MKKILLGLLLSLMIVGSSHGNEESQRLGVQGVALFKKWDFEGALKRFTQAINADPTDAWAYNNLGLLHAHVGNFSAAIQNYNTALNLAPKHCVISYNKGMAQHSKGDLVGARQTLEQWGAICPEKQSLFKELEKIDNKFLFKN